MFKKLLFSCILASSLTSYSQNVPSMVSYSVDTLCDGAFDQQFLTLIVQDLDGDSTSLSGVLTSINTFLDDNAGYTVINPPYVPGATLRTFIIRGNSNFGLPNGVNLDELGIDLIGNIALDGGAGYCQPAGIPIYGALNVTLDLSTVVACNNDTPFDISMYGSPAGGTFLWGSHEETNGSFDPADFYMDSGDGVFYGYTNASGCYGEIADFPTINIAPDVSTFTSASTCGNANGSAGSTITGQTPNFDIYWTTGFTEQVTASSNVSNLSSGTYYVTATDGNGCSTQAMAQITDADLTISENITDQTCPNSGNGAIDLTISGGTVDNVFWSNGASTEDITGLAAGEYTVSIHTTSNCQAFKTYYVSNPTPLGIDIVTIDGEDCTGTPNQSLIDITTTGGSGTYSWDWDSGTTTMEDFSVPGVGVHTCVVTDGVTGCSWTWSVLVPDYGAPWIGVNNIKKPTCNQNDGEIDVTIYENLAPITSVSWDNGASTEDITGLDAGTYIITATDGNGCVAVEKVELVFERPYQPSLCLLTVDTSFVYNEVVWQKDITQNISGFNVYRETQVQGQFELVADRPYALESRFMDNAASPMDRSWRYYLTTYDACGNESFPSFIHKTIHTVSTTSNGTDFVVHWDDYEGISYSSVDLMRFDATNGWTNIGTIPPGTNTAPDTPPVLTGLDYMVSFNLTSTCTSTKATDYNSSRSNRTTSSFDPGGSSIGIDVEELGEISIFPNPGTDILNIYIELTDNFESIILSDINGKIITSAKVNNTLTTLDISSLSNGVYIVNLLSADGVVNMKIIKQ